VLPHLRADGVVPRNQSRDAEYDLHVRLPGACDDDGRGHGAPSYGDAMKPPAALVLVAVLLVSVTEAQTSRHRAPIAAFRKANPCPATGETDGACPGYVVDHKYPLCAGGADAPENMQWQEYRESLVKDRLEIALCRCRASLADALKRAP
jgi:hypothetical protein